MSRDRTARSHVEHEEVVVIRIVGSTPRRVLAVLLVAVLAGACGGSTASPSAAPLTSAVPATSAPSSGAPSQSEAAPSSTATILKVLTDWTGTDQVKFETIAKAYTKKTGVSVQVEGTSDFATVLRTRVAGGDLPMVAIVPRPGFVADYANQGLLKSLDSLGLTSFSDSFQKAWVDLGSVGGTPYAITVKANSKSMIWDRPADLAAAGGAPATLDDFKTLLTKMSADGKKPLVVSGKDTWTLGDWFENIYLRTAGPQKYADLFGGKLPFTDQSVVDALGVMDGLIGNEAWLNGGRQIAISTAYQDGLGIVYGTKPAGQFFMEGGFTGSVAINDVNTSLKAGKDISFFPFPAIDPQYQNPVVGGGDFAIAFIDNDATRQFMAFLASTDGADAWASVGVISPNKNLDMAGFSDPLVQAEAQQLTAAGLFEFDGTDLMPGALGDDWNTTVQGIFQDPSKTAALLATYDQEAAAEFGR
jgi:alpha-glucoside transport system substrate-binding protein